MSGSQDLGGDRIRYFLFINGRWRWRPSAKMRANGFRLTTFGRGLVIDGRPIPTLEDKQAAIALNQKWDRVQRGEPLEGIPDKHYPMGSVGHCYQRALAMRAQARTDTGLPPLTKEQESRDDWPRAWKWLESVFGDVDPKLIQPEQLQQLRGRVRQLASEGEAHRVIKVWRALWGKMQAMDVGIATKKDPSLTFANSQPDPRSDVWKHREVLRLVQRAWREEYYGLAAAIAVAWDTMLSPIDVRRLSASKWMRDDRGSWFKLGRAKTGQPAVGTLSPWSEKILDTYLEKLPAKPVGATPLFWSRGFVPGEKGGRPWPPCPYTKDRLSEDFRNIRRLVFGVTDHRHLADMRRSGAVEATAGGAKVEKLAGKMANTIHASTRLQATYQPAQVAIVRDVDEAREATRH